MPLSLEEDHEAPPRHHDASVVIECDKPPRAPSGRPPPRNEDEIAPQGNLLLLEEKMAIYQPLESAAAGTARTPVEGATRLQAISSVNASSRDGNSIILQEKLAIFGSAADATSTQPIGNDPQTTASPPILREGGAAAGSMAWEFTGGSPSTARQLILAEKIAVHQTPSPTAAEPGAEPSENVDVDTSSSPQTVERSASQDANTAGLRPTKENPKDVEDPAKETDKQEHPIDSSGEMGPCDITEASEDQGQAQSHQDWDDSTSHTTEDIILGNEEGPPIATPVDPHANIPVAVLANDEDDEDNNEKNFFGFREKTICVVAALIVIAIAVAVPVALLLKNDPYKPPASRFELFHSILEPVSGDALLSTSTPQNLALEWLVNDDPAVLNPFEAPLSTLIERYVAALLYFGTDGNFWTIQLDFLTDKSICDWNNNRDPINGTGMGIYCNPNEAVIGILLDNNGLQGSLPSELQYLSELDALSLEDNSLTGTFPPEFGGLSKLSVLSLSINDLSGTLPTEIGHLSELALMQFGVNSFSGTIPTHMGSLSLLEVLSLYTNTFEGVVPSELGRLSLLGELYLHSNDFTGPIPSEMGQLSQLKLFTIWGNSFTGSIPMELGGLKQLEIFQLEFNGITGDLNPVLCTDEHIIQNLNITADCVVNCSCCIACFN